ncbi:flagellar biosynthesis protein FlhB [Thermosipho sp. 1223]|nr:flagellar biosynthesis protein FlhB [Thermosipho sp. 1244]OOC46105.1 flagellar biosynthesis protein FlhB [Thermosipho sp. 1223]
MFLLNLKDLKEEFTFRKKIAVALKYNPDTDYIPFVIAKGKEEVAQRIIDIAEKSGVAIVKSPKLVSELYKLEVLQEIPEKLYVAVAEIIAFIETQKGSD